METMEKEPLTSPVINSWRRSPTTAQIRYATDLCRTELPYAERCATIATFTVLDIADMSELIDRLMKVREARIKRLRGTRRARRR